MYRRYCAVVTQHDRNWTFMTCREHLDLAHAFFQASLTSQTRKTATEGLLERTGLLSCADMLSGTDNNKEMGPVGLSGGQRRRLSLAVALAKKPSLLIADEPTSGLDAAAAAAVMRVMRDLGTEDNVAVLCTIHQPSASVFECIDQLLILSKGRTVYLGPRAELTMHTASLGEHVPVGVSITEHMLNLVNADFASDERVNSIINGWQKSAPPQPPPPAAHSLPTEPARAPFVAEFRLLFNRHALKILPRDPKIMIIIIVLVFFDTIVGGLYFWNALRTNDQNMPGFRLQFFFNMTAATMLYNIFSTISAGVERMRVEREINNGMYSATLYMLVDALIAIPVTFFTGTWGILLAYVWGDFHAWSSLPSAIFLASVSQYYFAAAAKVSGWMFGDVTGASVFIGIYSIAFSTLRHAPYALSCPHHGLPSTCP